MVHRCRTSLFSCIGKLVGGLTFSLLTPQVANAQMPVLSFNNYTSAWEYTQGSYLIGWYFQTNKPITVTALGWYNDSHGLTSDHPVGIYDITDQTFVASADVTTTDPLTGVFRYQNLASSVNLSAGKEYALVGVSFRDDYLSFTPMSDIVVDPSITYLGGAIDYAGGATNLHPPAPFGSFPAYFPGSSAWPVTDLLFTSAQVPTGVPEPGNIALIAGLALAGTGYSLRRRRARA